MQPYDLRKKNFSGISFPCTPFKKDLFTRPGWPAKKSALAAETPDLRDCRPGGHRRNPCAVAAGTLRRDGNHRPGSERRVPVLTGVGVNTPIAIELARHAAAAGVSGILHFPAVLSDERRRRNRCLLQKTIADATPLGVIITVAIGFNPRVAGEKLARAIPNLIGLKDGQAGHAAISDDSPAPGDRRIGIGGAGDGRCAGLLHDWNSVPTLRVSPTSRPTLHPPHELASAGYSEELTKLMNELVIPLYELRENERLRGLRDESMMT